MANDHITRMLEIARASIQPALADEVVLAEPVRAEAIPLRELAAVSALVVLADLTIFRGHGYGGLALLWVGSPALLAVGRSRGKFDWQTSVVAGMLALLAVRTIWMGSGLGIACGAALVIAFSMGLAGQRAYVPQLAAYAVQLIGASVVGWSQYVQAAQQISPRVPRLAWLSLLLPLAAVALFGSMFILANPDLVTALWNGAEQTLHWLEVWAGQFDFPGFEILFCLGAASVAIGLLRPLVLRAAAPSSFATEPRKQVSQAQDAPLFGAIQNTLLAVIVLFGFYLVFEFRTLWFREFPQGFYYAGYAHRGAAWLTAALALATVVLSAIFQGDIWQDPRLPRLQKLAWIWSAQNLILAATVYNRMHIYIDFNGMTRMRMIGLFGITAVLIGFLLVVWKIIRQHDFAWLVQRQLWTVAIAAYVFALTPVDWLIHRYNVRQILSGDLAPAVQITEHPVNTEGLLVLEPLLECEDPIIRDGIMALLAKRAIEDGAVAVNQKQRSWTAYQLADQTLRGRLQARQSDLQPYFNADRRETAWQRFRDYAYQWY